MLGFKGFAAASRTEVALLTAGEPVDMPGVESDRASVAVFGAVTDGPPAEVVLAEAREA